MSKKCASETKWMKLGNIRSGVVLFYRRWHWGSNRGKLLMRNQNCGIRSSLHGHHLPRNVFQGHFHLSPTLESGAWSAFLVPNWQSSSWRAGPWLPPPTEGHALLVLFPPDTHFPSCGVWFVFSLLWIWDINVELPWSPRTVCVAWMFWKKQGKLILLAHLMKRSV